MGGQGGSFGIFGEPNQERDVRAQNPQCRGSRLSPLWVSEVFVLLTQIPWLVSMETVGLTSPWLPWCLVLEDLSRLYTARDKQGLQPKLLPLPSCHHLLTVTRSHWGWGDGDRTLGEGPEHRSCTEMSLWMPPEAAGVLRSHHRHSAVSLWDSCVPGRHGRWGPHRQMSQPQQGDGVWLPRVSLQSLLPLVTFSPSVRSYLTPVGSHS